MPKPFTPVPEFSRFFSVLPRTFGRAFWIPGVQTLKMGEKWEMFKMGKNEIKTLQKTGPDACFGGPRHPGLRVQCALTS